MNRGWKAGGGAILGGAVRISRGFEDVTASKRQEEFGGGVPGRHRVSALLEAERGGALELRDFSDGDRWVPRIPGLR